MKIAILVWVIGFLPLEIEFDTHSACRELELSLKRQAKANFKLTPIQIQGAGYDRYQGRSTPYFTPCVAMQ